jgi:hypothetical protein
VSRVVDEEIKGRKFCRQPIQATDSGGIGDVERE